MLGVESYPVSANFSAPLSLPLVQVTDIPPWTLQWPDWSSCLCPCLPFHLLLTRTQANQFLQHLCPTPWNGSHIQGERLIPSNGLLSSTPISSPVSPLAHHSSHTGSSFLLGHSLLCLLGTLPSHLHLWLMGLCSFTHLL